VHNTSGGRQRQWWAQNKRCWPRRVPTIAELVHSEEAQRGRTRGQRLGLPSLCRVLSVPSVFVTVAAVGESRHLAPLFVIGLPRVRIGDEEREEREEQVRIVKEGKQGWMDRICPSPVPYPPSSRLVHPPFRPSWSCCIPVNVVS
jgi:hypothetical protein